MAYLFRILPIGFVAGLAGAAGAQQSAGGADESFAQQLWQEMTTAKLVGEDAIRTHPYEGTEPHGAILEFLAQPLSVGDTEGMAIVKKNYGGENVSVESVWAGGRDALMAITVMFQREAGYDPDHDNWFWAKYGADGAIQDAGTVQGCIECHEQASGNDYIYSYDRSGS